MILLLFFLMLAGYAFGAAGALLAPEDAAARRWAATGAVAGGGAGLVLALTVFAGGTPFLLEYRSEVVRYLYAPVIAWVNLWAIRARAVQWGSAHVYPDLSRHRAPGDPCDPSRAGGVR